MSAEKLKLRYSDVVDNEKNKPSSSQKKNLDYVLLENEVWKYTHEYKNEIEYLKLVVFSLDSKLKVEK